jgi:hypothetical protein
VVVDEKPGLNCVAVFQSSNKNLPVAVVNSILCHIVMAPICYFFTVVYQRGIFFQLSL